MNTLFKIGMRNVRRNVRRTVITVLAIFFGVVVILLTRGLINGVQANLKSTVTDTQLGDLQLHAEGYLDSIEGAPLTLNLPADFVNEEMMKSTGATAVAPRIMFGGLISRGDTSTMVIAQAIDAAQEYAVTPRKKAILSSGAPLGVEDPEGIVLAEGLAKALKASPGDTVTILTNTVTGAMNAADFTVVGIMNTGSPFENKRAGIVSLSAAQRLLSMQGLVTEFAFRMPEDSPYSLTEEAKEALTITAGKKLKGTEVDTWKDLMPSIKDIIKVQNGIFNIVVGVLFFIVLVGIINTMLMSVMERVREVGTMMALGMRGPQVIRMFIFEALTLGVIGAVAGVIAGLALVAWLDHLAILMTTPGSVVKMPLRLTLEPIYPFIAMGVAVASALAAAIYPAWHASKLKPIDAIRNN